MNNEYLDMKKSIVTLLLVCLTMGSWAVEKPKQGFGFQISWAQPILRINVPEKLDPIDAAFVDSSKMVIKMKGFKVGVVYDATYIAGFGSTIGLNYTFGVYNSKWKSLPNSVYGYPLYRQRFLYHQLELFVDWQYKFEIAKETYLMLYTGPTLQCGVDFDLHIDKKDFSDDVTRQSSYDYYQSSDDPDKLFKRINVTWGVGAGFQYKRYFLRGGYDFGLMNPYKNSDFNGEDKHTRGRLDQWNIRLGVYLWYHE